LEQSREDTIRVKVFPRERRSRSRMLGIVLLNTANSIDRRVKIGESQEASASWHLLANASVLTDDWSSRSEITCAAITEPSGTTGSVAMLDSGKLPARIKNVIAICVGRRAMATWRDKVPAVLLQCNPIQLVWMNRQADF
jgi:hypothetical protein